MNVLFSLLKIIFNKKDKRISFYKSIYYSLKYNKIILCAKSALLEIDNSESLILDNNSYLIFLDSFKKAKKWVLTENLDLVAEKISSFFDEISFEVIKTTLQTYRGLGCWSLETNISKETYEASLDVFSFNKTISRRHDYSEVVYTD